jgi:hypothetical protein
LEKHFSAYAFMSSMVSAMKAVHIRLISILLS